MSVHYRTTNFKFLFFHWKTLPTCAFGGILVLAGFLTGKFDPNILQSMLINLAVLARSSFIWFITKHTELVPHEGMIF